MEGEYLIQYIYLDLGFPVETWYLFKTVAQNPVRTMVIILDGSPEIGALIRSNLCNLICLMHLIGSRAVTNRI